jgi:hypothetical protein
MMCGGKSEEKAANEEVQSLLEGVSRFEEENKLQIIEFSFNF